MGKRFILFTYIIALLLFAGSPDTAIITTDTTDIEDPSAMQVASLAASDYGTVYFSKGNGQKRAVCLTFDDGPDKVVTTKIINILNKYDVKGNFFFTGENVLSNPDVVRYAHFDGHLVLNHSYDHANYLGKSTDFIGENIDKASAAFKKVIGETPVIFRSPYDTITENLMQSIKQRGFKIVSWSLDTFDWREKDNGRLVSSVLDHVKPGGIVLFHSMDTNEATAKALPEIIEGLLAKEYEIVTLDQLLHIDSYESNKLAVRTEPDADLNTEDWEIVWHDEFSEDSLNRTKWNLVEWISTKNNELQCYSADNVVVKDGYLRVLSEKKAKNNREYTSGAVETAKKFSFLYGKIEIRARLPQGKGVFPALWLLADNNTGLPEIDIMEMLGHEPTKIWMVHHYIAKDGQRMNPHSFYVGPDFSADFHTFGLEWDPDKVVWFIDGEERFSITDNVPNVPLYLYMNTAIGGDWPGNPDKTTIFPQQFDIDYVRIWKKLGK